MQFLPLIALLFLGFTASQHSSATESRPNIVYILADDLGYGDVHCFNPDRGKIKTPNLDRLASQGMSFTDEHSGSSVCTPTRYGLLTGRYAWRTRLQSGVFDNYLRPLIAPDRLTVPTLLKQQGYHTACIGKWHLGFTLDGAGEKGIKLQASGMGAPLGKTTPDGPLTRGFDEFFGFHHAGSIKSLFENDRVTQIIEPVDMLPKLVEHVQGHIEERAKAGQPFFLYFALNSPHAPILPSKEWQGKSGLGDYGDYVMETDWAVGEVLAALDKANLTGKTLVIFSSDNGCAQVAKPAQLEAMGHFPSGFLRGYKTDIWDGGHRVPFIVRWPGQVKAGSQCAQLACHTDLMATCADILGVKIPDNAGEDSVSILPALLGTDKAPIHEAVVHHSVQGMFAIRQGQWKLEFCAGSGGNGKPTDGMAKKAGLPVIQLYDLKADPGEAKNVQADHPDIVQRMTALLDTYIKNGRSTPGAKQSNDVKITKVKTGAPVPEEE